MKKSVVFFILTTGLLFDSCKSKQAPALLEKISPSSSGINFQNKTSENDKINAFSFVNFYNGGGVATGDINNDGLADIYFTANSKSANKLYLNKGNFQFEDITAKAGVQGISDWCTGVTMADVNADGYLDIYVCAVNGKLGLNGHNALYINNKNGTFTERAEQYGLALAAYSTQAAFFDYDRDGDLDCFVLNQSDKHNAMIVDTSFRRKYDANSGDRLYRNDVSTTGKFTDVSAAAGIYQSALGYGLGLGVSDINNDGWDDIYIGNDFHENDYYYINTGKGTFTDGSYKSFRHFSRFSMGNDIADYDNDGQLDVVTVDMLPSDEKILKTYGSDERIDTYNYKITGNGYQNQYSRNCLQHNNGNGISFSDVGLAAGVAATDWSWSALFADYNNDGNKDLFITSGIVKRTADLDYAKFRNGYTQSGDMADLAKNYKLNDIPDGASYCHLYVGNGNGDFKETGHDLSNDKGYYNGASYADLDNDGDLDIVVNTLNAPAGIYRNQSKNTNWLSMSFLGQGENTFGIGTKVYLFTGGKIQFQELMLTRGFQSSVAPKIHFGLGTDKQVDSVLVVWPSQKFQVIKNVPANKELLFKEKESTSSFVYGDFFKAIPSSLKNVSAETKCNWSHKENNFTDFNSQYLIPHEESTRGPKLAVADVNKDGLQDLYCCGAAGQAGTLLLQMTDGSFAAADTSVFNNNRNCEEVAALFFDANGDAYPDLYTVSGGNEFLNGSQNLADHLYINDGHGHYAEPQGLLPELYFNKSCISTADIDGDGDADLFVTGLADAKQFGIPQSSYLLINDGKAHFTVASADVINSKEIGISTACEFQDVNQDGWPDLIVAGEWMPVKIYINNKGHFSKQDIPASTGLWQSLFCSDVNGDGYVDILAGNWGHNTKLWSGKNGPLKLYIKDFDHNGSIEQLMCYTIDGKEYSFLAKDELEQALPVLKKAYLTYSEVAGQTVQFMLDDLFKDNIELKAEVLASSCFINDGKGSFKRIDLPQQLQLAPVFSFVSMGVDKGFMGVGNFYGVIPYEGQYDALQPTQFYFDKETNTFKTGYNIGDVSGEFRDAKWVSDAAGGRKLVLARNNNSLLFFK